MTEHRETLPLRLNDDYAGPMTRAIRATFAPFVSCFLAELGTAGRISAELQRLAVAVHRRESPTRSAMHTAYRHRQKARRRRNRR